MLASASASTRLSSLAGLSSLSESMSLVACSARHVRSRGWCGVISTPLSKRRCCHGWDVLFSVSYAEFKTESEQYSTPRWKTPKVQHEEQKAKMLDCGCL